LQNYVTIMLVFVNRTTNRDCKTNCGHHVVKIKVNFCQIGM